MVSLLFIAALFQGFKPKYASSRHLLEAFWHNPLPQVWPPTILHVRIPSKQFKSMIMIDFRLPASGLSLPTVDLSQDCPLILEAR